MHACMIHQCLGAQSPDSCMLEIHSTIGTPFFIAPDNNIWKSVGETVKYEHEIHKTANYGAALQKDMLTVGHVHHVISCIRMIFYSIVIQKRLSTQFSILHKPSLS